MCTNAYTQSVYWFCWSLFWLFRFVKQGDDDVMSLQVKFKCIIQDKHSCMQEELETIYLR